MEHPVLHNTQGCYLWMVFCYNKPGTPHPPHPGAATLTPLTLILQVSRTSRPPGHCRQVDRRARLQATVAKIWT
jgi:hypothetical protein